MGHPHWNIFEWDHPDRKTAMSSTSVITASNRMKLKNASSMSSFYARDYRRFDDVYLMDGRTNRGRKLRLVFQDKGNGVVRVFTGWDLSRKKKL